ncbi:hypothetical protein GIB67_011728 [Kingdonia uniflora]|uniref:Sucrose synthase N-terminal domain-containing protein n=1 Tax=Kingdonia uniflora TaxID=39325 RepID=A0A7J7LUC4_9MAGN|nr:hypothetical protein GIB67_011728 [Kingdonia uniflora]
MAEKLTRAHSLRERLDTTLSTFRKELLTLLSRIESKGNGIHQPHHLLEDIKAISENVRKRLTEGVFGDIITSTQVRSSDLFDVNGCWSGSTTFLLGDN